MFTELTVAGIALVVLVFLSTVESAYESLSEVSLRLMLADREQSRRAQFFRDLLDHRRRFELILILGTQLSIAAIAVLLSHIFDYMRLRASLAITLVLVFLVIVVFRQLVPRLFSQNNPEDVLWRLLPIFKIFYRLFAVVVAPIASVLDRMRRPEPEE